MDRGSDSSRGPVWCGARRLAVLLGTAVAAVTLTDLSGAQPPPNESAQPETQEPPPATTAPEPEPRAEDDRAGDAPAPPARSFSDITLQEPQTSGDRVPVKPARRPWPYPYPPPYPGYPPSFYEDDPFREDWREAEPDEREPERRWYGWQTLVSDSASLTALMLVSEDEGGSSSWKDALIWTGLFGYFMGPPIIHWAHQHAGKGFGSLAIRWLSAGALIWGLPRCGDDSNGCAFALLGGLGLIAAIPIDAAVIAREDVPPDELEYSSLTVAPLVDAHSRSLGLSALGRF